MTEPIFCQTVGLEIEVTHINPHNMRLPNQWSTTNDASVESDSSVINGIPFVNHSEVKTFQYSNQVKGGEILSSIIDTHSNYVMQLKALCSRLITLGEPDQSDRAGLHIHLSFTNPKLDVLKNILKLGCHLEDVFFLLGGMGYEFRGIENDCSYCRPITTPGPQVIEDRNERLYPCFVIDDLLESNSITQFKQRLGDYNSLGESKYVPIRYHWLNLWNLWKRKHTLEFRIFNHSLKPRYIEAVVEISKAFGDAVMYYTYHPEEIDELSFNSVYNHRSKADIIETFLRFATSRLEPRIIDLALRIMDNTPIESIRFPSTPFYFHLRFHHNGNRSPVHWSNTAYRPSLAYSWNEVCEPHFEDIHNLRASMPRNSQPEIVPQYFYRTDRQPSLVEEVSTNEDVDVILDDLLSSSIEPPQVSISEANDNMIQDVMNRWSEAASNIDYSEEPIEENEDNLGDDE